MMFVNSATSELQIWVWDGIEETVEETGAPVLMAKVGSWAEAQDLVWDFAFEMFRVVIHPDLTARFPTVHLFIM